MPLHDVGYRAWNGTRSFATLRWVIVATTGIRLVWRGTWLRRTIFFTWLPAIVLASGFLLYEQALTRPNAQREVIWFLGAAAREGPLAEKLREDVVSARHDVWATLLMTFFRYPQAFVMVIVVGMIAPRLISYDLRSKAYLLYFSKPLTIWEYILGKSMVIWFYLAMITTVPACMMYVLGVLLSSEWSVVQETWDLPFRIMAASLVLVIPDDFVGIGLFFIDSRESVRSLCLGRNLGHWSSLLWSAHRSILGSGWSFERNEASWSRSNNSRDARDPRTLGVRFTLSHPWPSPRVDLWLEQLGQIHFAVCDQPCFRNDRITLHHALANR